MEDQMTAADVLCRMLEEQGVEVVFGHPGGAILPFYDAMHRRDRIQHVLTRHEQGAAHAADGYARATGRTGVCVATSGPGATNLVTGLATAMMDSVPVVALTGQVATTSMGTQAFQETDVVGVTMPVTKHGFLVTDPDELPAIVDEAFHLAASGRPGPVLVDLPKDVQKAPCTAWVAGAERPSPNGRAQDPAIRPSAADFDRAARLVDEAERPVIMAGRGVVVSATSALVRELAERADLPVVTTLLGLDAYPSTDARAVGMPGMHGTERANRAIQEADVILGLGLRFDDRVTGPPREFAPDATIIHMDIDPGAIERTVACTEPLVGDLARTLPEMVRRVGEAEHPDWWARLREWSREAGRPEPEEPPSGPLDGRTLARALARRIRASGGQVATDVGQHQMWLAQELADAPPGTHLTSGGLGAMGYGLPAGLGAALGRPDRPTWVVCGDGGFQMTLQEMATLAQERVPLKIAVMNNGYLGMVRQWQELFYEKRYAGSRITGPDFVALARAFGVPGRAVERAEELEGALDWAENAGSGPVLLDLRVLEEENVYPMVPAGEPIHVMVDEPAPEPAPAPVT